MQQLAQTTSRGTQTVQTSASRFLTLPGEIRNDIYKRVLTSTHSLETKFGQSNPPRFYLVQHQDQQPFNQLEYTCRQLATETTDLELKHNSMLIASKAFVMRAEITGARAVQRLRFMIGSLRSTHPSHIPWLGTIIIATGYSEPLPGFNLDRWRHTLNYLEPTLDSLQSFDGLCQKHPNLTIKYRGPHFSPQHFEGLNGLEILFYGVVITVALRGVDLSHLLPWFSPVMKVMLQQITRCITSEMRIQSDKLRFMLVDWPKEDIPQFPLDDSGITTEVERTRLAEQLKGQLDQVMTCLSRAFNRQGKDCMIFEDRKLTGRLRIVQ